LNEALSLETLELVLEQLSPMLTLSRGMYLSLSLARHDLLLVLVFIDPSHAAQCYWHDASRICIGGMS